VTDVAYLTLDVFTDRVYGGNQLAVFPDARAIPEDQLLQITREFNYSETTFCYPPADPNHAARVRIFTPGAEVPFAGHPTVGTAIALVALGKAGSLTGESKIVLEEGVGPVPVTVRIDGDGVGYAQFTTAKLPEFGPPPPSRTRLAEILSLEADDIVGNPQGVSCGLPFLIVPLRSVEAVGRARVRYDAWETTLKRYWASEIFVFAPDTEKGADRFRARCFVPGLSVPEDPATGSANACLAGYLAARVKGDGTFTWTVDQGVEMGRPSVLALEADRAGDVTTAIRVGGHAVRVMTGSIRLP
jgi:trans-2,3-dihydro-3-hydroxyanthranilate isomerase